VDENAAFSGFRSWFRGFTAAQQQNFAQQQTSRCDSSGAHTRVRQVRVGTESARGVRCNAAGDGR